jgi:hypothetical protein
MTLRTILAQWCLLWAVVVRAGMLSLVKSKKRSLPHRHRGKLWGRMEKLHYPCRRWGTFSSLQKVILKYNGLSHCALTSHVRLFWLTPFGLIRKSIPCRFLTALEICFFLKESSTA